MVDLTVFFENSPLDFRHKHELLPEAPNACILNTKFGNQLADYINLNMDSGPWLAGGSVRKSYLGIDMGISDWDIWFKDADQFNRAEKLLKDLNASIAYTSNNAISFKYTEKDSSKEHHIQIIKKRFYDNPHEIINNFDFSICQLVTDGHSILFGDNTARDLRTRTIRLVQPTMPAYTVQRMIKYMVYGYRPDINLIRAIEQNKDQIDWSKSTHDYDTV